MAAATKGDAIAQVADALFGTAAHSLRVAVIRDGPRGRVAERMPRMGRVWPPIELGASAASSAAAGQLWVGSLAAVVRPERLPALGIGCVVSIVDDSSAISAAAGRFARLGVAHEVVVVRDRPDAAALLACEWPRVLAAFSAASGRGKSTLLHCHAGISRSVATALAVITGAEAAGGMGQSLPTAARAVLLGRPQARPNDGLLGSLLCWVAAGGGVRPDAGREGGSYGQSAVDKQARQAGEERVDGSGAADAHSLVGTERPCAGSAGMPSTAAGAGSPPDTAPEAAAAALLAHPSMREFLPREVACP